MAKVVKAKMIFKYSFSKLVSDVHVMQYRGKFNV